MRTPVARAAAALAAALLLTAAGCSNQSDSGSDDSDNSDVITVEPVSAPVSPPTTATPAGAVTDFSSGLNSTIFDTESRRIAALNGDATALVTFDADDLAAAPDVLPLGGSASGLFAGTAGTVLVPVDREILRVNLDTAEITRISVDGEARSAAVLANGRLAVGDAAGTLHIFDDQDRQSATIGGLTSVDAIAVTDSGVGVLDRRQTSITEIHTDEASLGVALRAGEGAAAVAAGSDGRILVTDTVGKELLVYTVDDLILRQRFPVDAEPWGVAFDSSSDVVWVTLPDLNQVVGYTVDTGIPVETARYDTVQQPNSVAVDSGTGDLFVASAVGGGLQRITSEARTQGGT